MITVVHKMKSRFAGWEPNAVLLKELRQAVRSRILLGMFGFTVLLFFSLSLFILLQQSLSVDTSSRIGQQLCMACLGGLVIGCLLLIPFYTGARVAWEQRESDLMFFTPIRASNLVKGKILSGLYLAFLFYSAALPFMMLSNFLRGIDWLTIQFTLLVLLFAALLAILSALAVAVLPMPAIVKSIFGVGLLLALLLLSLIVFSFLAYMVEVGAGSIICDKNFWDGFIPIAVFSAFPVIICYGLSVSFIVPRRRSGNDSFGEIKFQPPTR